ncbi:MAG: SAM-dependent methyltransferase [Omnitrophica bacterium GWA2_52_8]|nr:MAG: SAM-dependent methyltransferase [Omnitrophica bacterium GWA2_52_8]
MSYVEFVTKNHVKTKRNYLERVVDYPRAWAARSFKEFGQEYWDGDRRFGYGGYNYDGRWREVADKMVKKYGLKAGDRVLDVGCGKGFLLYDFMQAVPGIEVRGIDVSEYAIEHAKEEVKPFLSVCSAAKLPFEKKSFDLVISINVLHNLYVFDFYAAMKEIERVGRKNKYVCVESWRNEEEKANLLYWGLPCEMFCRTDEWEWWFKHIGYTGDHEYIFFE